MQTPCSLVLIVVMYWPAAHVTCSVQLVPSNQYPALHATQWFKVVRLATLAHVAHADPVPVEHAYVSLHDVSPLFISYPVLQLAQ